jgi:hypothetical protein
MAPVSLSLPLRLAFGCCLGRKKGTARSSTGTQILKNFLRGEHLSQDLRTKEKDWSSYLV